jgi:hypothetical protein
MKYALPLALSLAAFATMSASAQPPASPAAAGEEPAPPQPECTEATARAVPIGNAISALMPGACVTVEGVSTGAILTEDAKARYRAEDRYNDPSSTGAMIGLLSPQPLVERAPVRVRVIGRTVDCDRLNAENARLANNGREVINVTDNSYCGRFRGRAIDVVTMQELGPAVLTRLTRAGAGPDLGNLSPLATGDVRRQMERAMQRLSAAVAAGDRAAIEALHRDPRTGTLDSDPEVLAAVFGAVPLGSRLTAQVFGWREPRWADAQWHAQRARTGTAEAIGCLSAASDAQALWPIDSKDADNLATRPYVCTRLTLLGTGADAPVLMSTTRASSGLPEPSA